MAEVSLKGRLLVANPTLSDPNFDRTVVYVLAHEPEGALGLVLNRPSGMELEEPLPRWERLAAAPAVVFVGGPVSPSSAICLAQVPAGPADEVEGFARLTGTLGTVDLEHDPDDLEVEIDAVRVFAGHAGWAARQLDDEIRAGGWFVVPALPGDVMSADPAQLWKHVLRRQVGRMALVAGYPPDPELN